MDRPPEQPWRDYEKVRLSCSACLELAILTSQIVLFTNIIKASNVSPDDLFRFIQHHQIGPNWEQTALPYGELFPNSQAKHPTRGAAQGINCSLKPDRPLAECIRQYEAYRRSNPYQPRGGSFSAAGPSQFPHPPVSYRGPMSARTYDPQTSGGRVLLPKTAPTTPSEAGPAYPGSPISEQPPSRKRGRPPKEEVDRRKAEARLRGEEYPPPRTKRTKRASVPVSSTELQALMTPQPGVSTAPTFSTPQGVAPPETGSDSSGSKRRRANAPRHIDVVTTRSQGPSSSYESPPATSLTQGQASASTTSGVGEVETRVEGSEENLPPPTSRGQSYREIVGIRRSG